jgi:putative membrane protein
MSFQRTRLSADRTLMSVIRTSLALISFGFTIYTFFRTLAEQMNMPPERGRNFAISLVVLGVIMLILGIAYHARFMLGLRHTRDDMRREGLIYAQSQYPVSMTLIVAVLLLLLGLLTVAAMVFHVGPIL